MWHSFPLIITRYKFYIRNFLLKKIVFCLFLFLSFTKMVLSENIEPRIYICIITISVILKKPITTFCRSLRIYGTKGISNLKSKTRKREMTTIIKCHPTFELIVHMFKQVQHKNTWWLDWNCRLGLIQTQRDKSLLTRTLTQYWLLTVTFIQP